MTQHHSTFILSGGGKGWRVIPRLAFPPVFASTQSFDPLGNLFQAGELWYLASTNINQRAFAPSALPDFVVALVATVVALVATNATMPSSDFPCSLVAVMHSREESNATGLCRRSVRHMGPPKFLISLSTPAAPSHPGSPDGCICLLLHHR
jgi:hypothetical protein